MLTKDDVLLLWQESKYLKKRDIASAPDANSTDMYMAAAETQKPVIARVYNIVKYEKQRIRRFEFNLFLLRKYFHGEQRTPREKINGCYFVDPGLPLLQSYRPSVEFSTIKIVQPLDWQPSTGDNYPHLAADKISRKPRVTLKPPYGVDFGGRLDESIPIEHIMVWMPTINTAYEAVAAQFFKDGVLV